MFYCNSLLSFHEPKASPQPRRLSTPIFSSGGNIYAKIKLWRENVPNTLKEGQTCAVPLKNNKKKT
jgi:hypothetical protein